MYPVIHISLPTYAVLAAFGGIAVVFFLYFRIEKYELLFLDFIKMLMVCIFSCFLGSRILYILSRLPWLLVNFSIDRLLSMIVGGGLVFYGGLFGALGGIFLYCKKHKISRRKIYNMIAPAIPLFHSFGRIGCFLSGCCFGIEYNFSLFGVLEFSRIPTQLIEALFELLLFFTLLVFQKKWQDKDSLKTYMVTYAIFRFFIEFLRGDDIRGFLLGFSTSQIISLGIVAFYIITSLVKNGEKVHPRK